MSKRHRDTLTPRNADERRRSRRAVRHGTTQVLATTPVDELDGVVLPEPLRTVPHQVPEPRAGREHRHWKLPFWKRRASFREIAGGTAVLE